MTRAVERQADQLTPVPAPDVILAGRAAEPLRLKSGVDWGLEDEADRLLNADRRAARSAQTDDSCWLSRDQLLMRAGREIGNEFGVCDPAVRRGMFKRVYNPWMGQRPNGHGRSDE